MNDAIDPALCSIQYASFDPAVDMIRELGPAALLTKRDIKPAVCLYIQVILISLVFHLKENFILTKLCQ